MRATIVMAVLALAGCATARGMREEAPFFASRTAKAIPDVVGCVATAWGQAGFNLRTEVVADRTSVILAGSTIAGSDMAADIYADGTVRMFRRAAIWSGLDVRLRDQLAGCL